MMCLGYGILLGVLLLEIAPPSGCVPERPPAGPSMGRTKILYSFDQSLEGWQLLDPTLGEVGITHDPQNVKQGAGALEYTYVLEPDVVFGVGTGGIEFAATSTISFFVKTDAPSWLGVGVTERDGSAYAYYTHIAEAEQWQEAAHQARRRVGKTTLARDNSARAASRCYARNTYGHVSP